MATVRITDVKLGDTWKKKLQQLSAIRAGVKIGFVDGATYEDGTSVAYVAYINETGMGNNPPRPFMKKTLLENADKWIRGILSDVKGRIFDRRAILNAYDKCGIVGVGDMKRTILDWPDSEPRYNKIETVKRKSERGANGKNQQAIDPFKALVDTGVMVKAVSYEVTEE